MHNFKKEFMLDPTVVFLNHGSFGATPKPVFSEYQRWQRELERQPVEFLGRRFPDLMQNARTRLAAYLSTAPDNLVFVPNATVGINIVVRSLDLKTGDEVLATDHEYGAADRTWRFIAAQKGFRYINFRLPLPFVSHDQIVESFMAAVTPNTRVIFLSHYSSPTALIFPIAEICRRAREKNILTLIDGAHAPGQIDLDLNNIGADFYSGNLHKWLCAPKGSAFLYARPEVQDIIQPLVVSWGWQSEQPGPSRFIDYLEWTGTRDISSYLSVPSAIDYQTSQRWRNTISECYNLAAEARERIALVTGLDGFHPNHPDWYKQMSAMPLPETVDACALKSALYEDFRIEIPIIRWNNLNLIRFSIQVYNSREDIIKLESALKLLLA